jgi:hypothetical protein
MPIFLFGQQTWTWPITTNTNGSTPAPSSPCGDIYLVSYTAPNGNLEIAVNYHFKSSATPANGIVMQSLNIDIVQFGTSGLTPDISNALPNTLSIANANTPQITINANGQISYSVTSDNANGLYFTPSDGQTTLFTFKYLNNVVPYTGGCALFDFSATKTYLNGGGKCSPDIRPIGGNLYLGSNTYRFCGQLQTSQLITIDGNISAAVGGCLMEDVNVAIECTTINTTDNTMTNASGNYESPTNASKIPKNDYIITASKSDGILCGISTLDIVLMSKHILGTQFMNNWASLIAADVNNNGTITTADILELRKMILGIQTNFTKNTSWRFFDRLNTPQVAFSMAIPPIAPNIVPNSGLKYIKINSLNGSNNSNKDFLGVKIGDVSGNWCISQGSGCALPQSPPRENGEHEIWIDDVAARAGDNFEIVVRAGENGLPSVYSTGISINSEMTEILDVIPLEMPNLSNENFNVDYERGNIKMLWALESDSPVALYRGQQLFRVRARAKHDILTLENVLSLNDELSENIIYCVDEGIIGHALELKLMGANYRQLSANKNNDSNKDAIATLSEAGQSLILKYYTPQEGNTKLTVYDLQGRLVFQKQINSILGYNTVDIDFSNQKQSEMYLYYLETPKFPITGKIIKINH